MNAKYSLFTISLVVTFLCFAAEVGAQSAYDRATRSNLWNDGLGVNGVRQAGISIADASLTAGVNTDSFLTPYEAPFGWSAEASTRGVKHLKKFTGIGAFSFTQNQEYRVCGPMSIDPGFWPVEVWEYTPGNKTLQSYKVDGGISVDIGDCWRIGGRFEMDSRNYSKRKDLRHTNYRLDMECRAGLMWHSGEFAVEIDGIAGKNSETINAEQIGTTVASYEAFLDKGLMYGVAELWEGSGIHLKEAGVNGLPLVKLTSGAALEAGFGQKLFLSLQYRHSDGHAGEKEFIWFRFPSDRIDAKFAARSGVHTLRLSMFSGFETNYESVLDKVTSGGVTTVANYGYNLILQSRHSGISPSYEYDSDNLFLSAVVDFDDENTVASQMYPYLHRRNAQVLDFTVGGCWHDDSIEASLYLGAGKGWMSESESLVSDVLTGPGPIRKTEDYAMLAGYAVIPKGHIGYGLRWYPKRNYFFVGLSGRSVLALEKSEILPGMSRHQLSISIGSLFLHNEERNSFHRHSGRLSRGMRKVSRNRISGSADSKD